jgi:hypothetical protein
MVRNGRGEDCSNPLTIASAHRWARTVENVIFSPRKRADPTWRSPLQTCTGDVSFCRGFAPFCFVLSITLFLWVISTPLRGDGGLSWPFLCCGGGHGVCPCWFDLLPAAHRGVPFRNIRFPRPVPYTFYVRVDQLQYFFRQRSRAFVATSQWCQRLGPSAPAFVIHESFSRKRHASLVPGIYPTIQIVLTSFVFIFSILLTVPFQRYFSLLQDDKRQPCTIRVLLSGKKVFP